MRNPTFWPAAIALALAPAVAAAQQAPTPASPTPEAPADTPPSGDTGPESYAIHAQSTFTVQATPGFASPYAGANSLTPNQGRETFDATAFLGVRLWKGAELWANPEIDQGFGLSDTLGIAGFPSAEAYKVGKANPYFKLQKAFVRQTIDLGGDRTRVDGAANQLAGSQTANHIIVTIGKFGVGDVFDTNRYAHDPRGDFLNWAMVDTGTFDYAANAWGYSYGAAGEWYQGDWTLRAGIFNLSKIPNGEDLESNFSQYELDGEVEHRHTIGKHPGAIRVTAYRNHARMARLADAIAIYDATGAMPDLAALRRPGNRLGVSLNAEQEATANLGFFLRAGVEDGTKETYEFTDIDRTLAVGASLKGAGWGRASDTVGLAAMINGISKLRQTFLADGGLGVLIGDGQLPHPGDEKIVEGYYLVQMTKGFNTTFDAQFIANPGYNRDRGPVGVLGVRFHGAF